jgi:hypothetical protein
MHLTPLGAQAATMGAPEKKKLGNGLVKGSPNINKYTKGVCYDAAALVRYLLGGKISTKDIETISSQGWQSKFKFKSGKKWDGKASIKAGSAVGFYRQADKKIFHAAISTGGSKIRAVNGNKLGAGWAVADLKKVLGDADSDSWFEHDGTKVQVFISKI